MSSCQTSFLRRFRQSTTIMLSVLLSACGGSNESIDTAELTPSVIRASDAPAGIGSDIGEVEDAKNPLENNVGVVPAPSSLTAQVVRAGFVSISWDLSVGDSFQTHPSGDAVSYYRVYRNGEFLVDALSPFIEDNSAPQGRVIYSVEAHKLVSAPEYALLKSDAIDIEFNIDSFAGDALQNGGSTLDLRTYNEALQRVQQCVNSHVMKNGQVLCSNGEGYAWSANSGEMLNTKSSIAGDWFVSVRNVEPEIGLVPGVPTWSARNLSSGVASERDINFDEYLVENEGAVVNGVALSINSVAYISGTVYQSYLPRNLGPEVGILPVTNAYFIASYAVPTGELLQFRRIPLHQAPGSAARVNDGFIEMHKVGQVSFYDTSALEKQRHVPVAGFPVFSDEHAVYTRSFGPEAYYQFNLN